MPKRHITITSWTFENFAPTDISGDVFISFHELNGEKIGDKLLGVSEPASTVEIQSGLITAITLDSLEVSQVLVVVHSTSNDPSYIASGIFSVTDEISQTHEIKLDFEVAVFSSPIFICNITCIREMNLVFIPGNIVIGRRAGIVNTTTPQDCVVEMYFGKISQRLAIAETVLVGGWQVGHLTKRLSIPIQFDPTSKEKVEIVFKNLKTADNKGRLIDVFRLCDLAVDQPVSVGSREEGFLVVCNDEFAWSDPPKVYQANHCLFQCRNFYLQIDFIPEEWFGGSLWFGPIDPVCDLAHLKTIQIDTDTVVIEIDSVYTNEQFVPVLGLVVRDRQNKLKGIYTVRLRDIDRLVFENQTIVMGVTSEEKEGADSISVPMTDKVNHNSLSTHTIRRIHITIASMKGMKTKNIDSVFVTVLTVRLDVPPVLLACDEVLKFSNYDREGITSAVTCGRNLRFGNAVWETDLEIDIGDENWLYFIVYGQIKGTTVALGHACSPANSSSPESLVLVGIDTPWYGSIDISMLKPMTDWCGLWVYQDMETSNLRLFDESVKLEVQFYLNPNEPDPLRTSHIWLPIKDYVPLYIRDCPPTGCVRLGLFALNGRLLSEGRFQLSARETSTFTVGGVGLIISRKKIFP